MGIKQCPVLFCNCAPGTSFSRVWFICVLIANPVEEMSERAFKRGRSPDLEQQQQSQPSPAEDTLVSLSLPIPFTFHLLLSLHACADSPRRDCARARLRPPARRPRALCAAVRGRRESRRPRCRRARRPVCRASSPHRPSSPPLIVSLSLSERVTMCVN